MQSGEVIGHAGKIVERGERKQETGNRKQERLRNGGLYSREPVPVSCSLFPVLSFLLH
jgi:hypothetical protein